MKGTRLIVENHKSTNVLVMDGVFMLGSVGSDDTREFDLPGRGLRPLKVRWGGNEMRTEARRFEDNAAWHLTVNLDGRLDLDLQPAERQ